MRNIRDTQTHSVVLNAPSACHCIIIITYNNVLYITRLVFNVVIVRKTGCYNASFAVSPSLVSRAFEKSCPGLLAARNVKNNNSEKKKKKQKSRAVFYFIPYTPGRRCCDLSSFARSSLSPPPLASIVRVLLRHSAPARTYRQRGTNFRGGSRGGVHKAKNVRARARAFAA